MSNVHARCARGKISLANNIADIEEEILLQANLLLLLVLKRRHRQLQKRRKHRFWVRKIFMKRQKLGAFHTLLRELRVSDRTVTNINEHSGFVAKKFWIIWVRIKIIMGYVSIADRRTLVSIWSQDRKRSQAIVCESFSPACRDVCSSDRDLGKWASPPSDINEPKFY